MSSAYERQKARHAAEGAIPALEAARQEFINRDCPGAIYTTMDVVGVLNDIILELKDNSVFISHRGLHPLTAELLDFVDCLVDDFGYESLASNSFILTTDLSSYVKKLHALPVRVQQRVLEELREDDPLCDKLADDLTRLLNIVRTMS